VYSYVDHADLFEYNINTEGIPQKSFHKSIKVGLELNVGNAT
jgi:hypothetical protein